MAEQNKLQAPRETPGAATDVVVCGGGLAGLLLARQLRRELPELSVAVLERTRRPLPDACHKVGESSVELASQYLERLGLESYLLERHLVKLGLRFFPGGGHLPLAQRTEIGPCAEPIVRSYQLDRGRLEEDLRAFAEADGVELVEGAKVTGVDLGADADDHRVAYELDGVSHARRARWVVDATGRNALLRRKLKLTRGLRHEASAGWFRVRGRLDLNDLVPAEEREWHARPCADKRWRSTNHFMGPGYWAWLIPLSTGHTSVGLVIHEELHSHTVISSHEAVMEFLRQHEPFLARMLEAHAPQDFLCLRKYSHTIGRAWSAERWALVGEAGAFVDPLYSPGSDFIALANCFTTNLIATERAGGDLVAKAAQLSGHYRAMVAGTTDLFRRAGPVYGHPSAMATKIFWDNFSYWSFTCHFFQQDLYRLSNEDYEPFGAIGRRFLALGSAVQGLLRAWAELAPEEQKPVFIGAPHFPSVLIDAHVKVGLKMSHAQLLEYLTARVPQLEELAGEVVVRALRVLGPERGREALERASFSSWGIRIPPSRVETEALSGHARRTRLSSLAHDVERTLGKIVPHPRAAEALELLLEKSGAT